MPLITDKRKNLLESSLSKRLVSDETMLDRQFENAIRPEWSELYFQNIKYFNSNEAELKRTETHCKEYPWSSFFPLKEDTSLIKNNSLIDSLADRKTNKDLSNDECSFEILSNILALSGGQKNESKKRFNPSGGQRYPLEIYVFANKVENLCTGIYHYNVKRNGLESLSTPIHLSFLEELYLHEAKVLKECSFIIFMTAIAARSTIKYGNFGYRLIFLEAGHLSQSMWLLATASQLKSWPLSALQEKNFYKAFNINPHQEFFVQSMVFGK